MDDRDQAALPRGGSFALVFHLLRVGQPARAREMAAALVAADPDDAGAHVALSAVLAALGELGPAQTAADEAVRLAPDLDVPHAQRARVLLQAGRFAAAERAVLEALALDPDDADHHHLYARLLAICERHREALRALTRALELDPDESTAHQLRATLLLKTRPRDWSVSQEAAMRAVALDPEDADAHAVLGAVHLRAGRLDQAEQRFRAALELAPHNPLALSGLTEALMGRNLLYRPFLGWSLFMQRISLGARVAVVAGLWVFASGLAGALRGSADLALLSVAVRWSYLAFCAYTWFAEPVTRFLLARHYTWMRHVDV